LAALERRSHGTGHANAGDGRVKIQPFLDGFTTARFVDFRRKEDQPGRASGMGKKIRPKGLLQTSTNGVLRFAAVALTALLLCLMWDAGHSAYSQIQRAQPQNGRPPIAAPTGPAAESAQLAAPAGIPNSAAPGAQAEVEQAFTPLGLFLRADIVVKCVLTALVLASFWSWVLIIDKWIAFGTLNRKAKRFEKTFWSGRSLDELYAQHSKATDQPYTAVFVAALREWKRSFEGGPPRETQLASVKERVEKAMNVSIQREVEKIERGLGYLATVGSTAPFVGLFGTVWGIMTAFQAIAARQDTTLAVVAPGIADALFATALGLVAAIPAVVAYNRFLNELGRYTGRLESFADEFSTFLSRQLDERAR
jgi:biopolymer transport protein TolQ